MNDSKKMNYRRGFWLLLGIFTIFRLILSASFGLGMDESHYALYARNLAWGYFDHPPLVGFLAAFTTIPGENLFFLRLGPVLCWSVSAIFARKLCLSLFGCEKTAFWSVAVLLFMPIHHLLAIALLPDATLNMFWCGTLLSLWLALKSEGWKYWLIAGLCFGGALLSKYHAVLLPMCLFLYVIFSSEQRRWLASPKPYAAVIIGLGVFLPNVFWNMHNEWISYAFQLGHGGGSGYFSFSKLFESLGGQLAAATPILMIMLAVSWAVIIRRRKVTEAERFIFWTSFPVFLFFCGIGLFGKVLPHWPAVGWWTGAILLVRTTFAAGSGDEERSRAWMSWFRAGSVLGAVCVVLMYILISFPLVRPIYNAARDVSEKVSFIKTMDPYRSKFDISNDLYGWDEAGAWVEEIKAQMPRPDRTFVFCHRFFTTSQLKVYLDPSTPATSLHRKPSQYRLWFDEASYKGWDAIFVDDNHWPQDITRYESLFEGNMDNGRAYAEKKIMRGDTVAHTLRIYRYKGFKGLREPDRH